MIDYSTFHSTSIDKSHQINSSSEWRKYTRDWYKNTQYHKYTFGNPDHYPCIGIEVTTPEGELGSRTEVTNFVYLDDFKV